MILRWNQESTLPVSFSIKNVPDDLAEEIRARARRHHRSLQGELLTILQAATASRGLSIDQLLERIEARGLRTPAESTGIIRRRRDAR